MIRLTTPQDINALMALIVATGLFAETEPLEAMLSDYFTSDQSDKEHFWLTDDMGEPVGVAYCAPERLTSGTWNLLLIAIRPDYQGQGRGATLLRYIEHHLTARGGRLLLVETSGVADFERTRTFYRKCGYEQEATIRDYYDTGDDKIVFRKLLTVSV